MIKYVNRFIKQYKLKKGNIDFEYLENIIKNQGYKIIPFNEHHNRSSIRNLFDTLNIDTYKTHKKSFIYTDEYHKLLFIRNGLSDKEKETLYLHELGHIWKKHTTINDSEILQEYDADKFSVYVGLIINVNYYIKIGILLISIIILIFFVYKQNEKYRIDIIDTPVPTLHTSSMPLPNISANNIVAITKFGDKYHRTTCIHVQEKPIAEMTINEAIKMDFEPCKVCNP